MLDEHVTTAAFLARCRMEYFQERTSAVAPISCSLLRLSLWFPAGGQMMPFNMNCSDELISQLNDLNIKAELATLPA